MNRGIAFLHRHGKVVADVRPAEKPRYLQEMPFIRFTSLIGYR